MKKIFLLAIGLLAATNGTIRSEFSGAQTGLAAAVGIGAAASFCYWLRPTIDAVKKDGFKKVLTQNSNIHRLVIDAATIGLVLICLSKSRLKAEMDFAIFKAKYGSGARS